MSNIVLRNVILPRETICDRTELYYRVTGGTAVLQEQDTQLHISGTAAFDTYFNSLDVLKYQKYCRLSALLLRLRVSGTFVVRVFGVKWLPEGVPPFENGFTDTLLLEKNLCYDVPSEESIDLTAFLGEKYLHLYFTLTTDNGTLYSGAFEVDEDTPEPVNIAVVICTYKREPFLLRNHGEIVSYLARQNVLHTENIHFYIVDNGCTLDRDVIENAYVTLLPNENTGGSGGFTRGYREAVESGRHFTHILFMDDDIVLDCEMLLRVYSILRCRKPEYNALAVGGTMLRLSDRITCHEAGALWDGKRLHSIGNGDDMTRRDKVFGTSYEPSGDYNAWWFYCFPAAWQKQYGYPLPFFIKEDDIEYSLRCQAEIAVVNGIAVWHDDFDGKYDGFQEYYIKRNELILTSVNRQKPYALFQVRKLILSVMKQTVYQRYFLADLIFRAYDDYLKGAKYFWATDTAALNQELMSSCQPLLRDDELLTQYGVTFDEEKYIRSRTEPEHLLKQALSLNGYLVPYVFYRKDKDDYAVCDLAQCRYVNFYKHKRVLHYDRNTHRGYVTRQKKRLLWWNILRLCIKSVKFLLCYPFARRSYQRYKGMLFQTDNH